MNINKKIIGSIILCFLLFSIIITLNLVSSIKKTQVNNLQLIKIEFLELGRSLFEKNSDFFFKDLNSEINKNNGNTIIFIENFIKDLGINNTNVIIFDIKKNQYLEGFNNPNIINLYDKSLIEGYINENIITQKTDFSFDNFDSFKNDITNTVIPNIINFHLEPNSGVIIGYGESFLTTKIRIDFIERQNKIFYTSQIITSIITFIIILLLIIIFMITFMKRLIISPLDNIVNVARIITNGDLNKQVEIKSNDEISQLGIAFNKMTSKLKESYVILETKVENRTKELNEERESLDKRVTERTAQLEELKNKLEDKVEERTSELNIKLGELEKMNKIMVGRELIMVDLKKENIDLKSKLNIKD